MPSSLRQLVVPVYLLACLLLGGSVQGVWSNMILQLVGVGIIASCAMAAIDKPLSASGRQVLGLAIIALALVALQLVPLPSGLWPHLGGRERVAAGFRLLGMNTPPLPLSLTPGETLATVLTLIPPVAVLCAMIRLNGYRPSWIVVALLLGTFAGILLGALQVTSADPLTSPWYLYAETNWGVATGFFANANHMASLLVCCLPFLAALFASARRSNKQIYSTVLVLVAGAAVVLVVGIVLNGSLAGYLLTVPVLVASALIIIPAVSPLRRWIALAASVLVIAALIALWKGPIRTGSFGAGAAESVQTREEMLSTTMKAAKDFLPFGSGVGSFEQVYPLYENPQTILPVTVVHAHNDYAELALETGIPGIVLILLFLGWWASAVSRVWRFPEAGSYARAASIASAAILVHSIVDYPLRTAAMSAVFAMSLGFLVQRRAPAAAEKGDLWPTRHLVFR